MDQTRTAVTSSTDADGTAALAIPGLRIRPYSGDDGDVEGMALVAQAAARADGEDWFPTIDDLASDLRNAPNSDPRRDVLVAELEGQIVGYGRVYWAVRDGRHVYHTRGDVHPDIRRRGLGRTLLRLNEERLRAIAAGHPDAKVRVFSAEVHDRQAGALALLTGEGYAPVRWFFEMARSLDEPIPGRDLPPGLEVRPLRPEDRRRVFAAEAEAFRDHWGQREWTEADFRWAFESPSIRPDLWRVAWAGDEVAGVVATYVSPEENETLGIRRAWLERVSVRRPWRRAGVASALMLSAMTALKAEGFRTAALGVDADNPNGAVAVYERLGFRRTNGGMIVERPMEPRAA
jgi:mycothiol synthase